MGWGGGVVDSNDNLELGQNLSSGLFVSAYDVEGTGPLTVESHDLGEGLSDDHLEALVEEVSQALSILVEVSSDEALVGGVEKWVEASFLDHDCYSLPLVQGGVHTGGVVGAGMQQHDRSLSGVLQILDHSLEVQALGLLVEVPVLSHLKASGGKYRVVVAPCRVAHVDGRGSELSQEFSDDSEGTGSGKSLGRSYSSAVDVLMVPSEQDTSSSLVEVGHSINWQVFFL